MKVLIAGGGIGGLAFAAAARRAGITCEVYERAPELRPIGAGITVQMNAILALASAGLDGPVRAAGLSPSRAEIRVPSGRVLQSLDIGAIARAVGAQAYTITRARLHEALLGQLAPGIVRTGATVERFSQDDRGVTITLAGGATATGDVLIGADGLRSAIRAQIVGDGEPRYAGYGCWRALVQADVDPDVVIETWGAGSRFGIVPVARGEVYVFGVANLPAGQRLGKAELASRFSSWHDPIPSLIERATDILYGDIADRAPRTTWTDGRVALLGDAIHPMTPNLGQGGGQAIEDAIVLARCLADAPDHRAAFARYEAKRVARANTVVVESRRAGAIMQLENAALRAVRDVALRLTPAGLTRRRVASAMRFTP